VAGGWSARRPLSVASPTVLRVWTSLLDVLLPGRCLGCGRAGWPFCEACAERVTVLGPPGCRRCGRPLEATVDRCADCPPGPVAWARAPFLYEGPVRQALMRLKFAGWRSGAAAFAPWMEEALLDEPPLAPSWRRYSWSVVTWVPLGRRRRRERGFDQAEALARAVARRLGLPVVRLLERVVETGPQARRSGAERREALRGAFRARARPPPWVVLVDDVLTSGATAGECAQALRIAGAVDVGLVTAARSLGSPVPARCRDPVRSTGLRAPVLRVGGRRR